MSNKDKLNEIVSQHLGKAGDGTVVKPYVTPDKVDPTLLVPVPRDLNREMYNIEEDNLPFVGYDIWNCYEVSFLLDNGFPVSGLVKLVYPSNSECIVESKSLKLYLNSYNMAKFGNSLMLATHRVQRMIEKDLSSVLDTEVNVTFHYNTQSELPPAPVLGHFARLEGIVDVEDMEFDHYNEDPDILEVVPMLGFIPLQVTSNNLRSNCRVTNQPDWGDVYIHIDGPDCVTPESLMKYIVSMRKENHFHEEICECIFKRLHDILDDETEILVACLYTRRGGIDINPVRATSDELMEKLTSSLIESNIPHRKTERQ
jgi:7-cyano-7-deazaguanine reductase